MFINIVLSVCVCTGSQVSNQLANQWLKCEWKKDTINLDTESNCPNVSTISKDWNSPIKKHHNYKKSDLSVATVLIYIHVVVKIMIQSNQSYINNYYCIIVLYFLPHFTSGIWLRWFMSIFTVEFVFRRERRRYVFCAWHS